MGSLMLLGNHGLYRHGATFGRGWTPAALGSALALWLDADDAATITLNGSTVSQWNDKSGNNRNASQAIAANQPTRTLNGLGGRTVITFDGTNDWLGLAASVFSNQLSWSYAVVALKNSATEPVCLFTERAASNNASIGVIAASSTILNRAGGTDAATVIEQTEAVAFPVNAAQILGSVQTPTSGDAYRNGNLTASNSATKASLAFRALAIGGNQLNGNSPAAAQQWWSGTMGEVVITNTTLSTTNRQLLEGYLAWKWGLVSSLPYTHPYRWDGRVFGGVQLWRPSNLGSTLALWLDAEDAASITLNGSTVSQWNDKSGNARNVSQATAANQPTRTLNGLNGKPVVTFDGADWLFNANPGAVLRNVAGGTVAAVMNYTNAVSQRIPVVVMNGTGAGVRLSTVLQVAGTLNLASRRLDTDASASTVTSPPTYTNGTNVIQVGVARYSDGALDQFINGTAGGTGSFPSSGNSSDTDSATLIIGGTSTDDGVTLNANQMLGFVGEAVYTNTALSTNDRQRLEGYFAWKWGLQNSLPVGHPFRLIPPSL